MSIKSIIKKDAEIIYRFFFLSGTCASSGDMQAMYGEWGLRQGRKAQWTRSRSTGQQLQGSLWERK